MDLTVDLYSATRSFPQEELYGLTRQICRAASSIPANIAEGYARGKKEYRHFVTIAQGSLTELETHLMIAQRLGFWKKAGCHPSSQRLAVSDECCTSFSKD